MSRAKGTANKGKRVELMAGTGFTPQQQFPAERIRSQRLAEGRLYAETDEFRLKDCNVLGTNLKAARERAGLSQGEVAQLIGKTTRALRNYESGDTVPDAVTLIRMCHIYGTTVDRICGDISAEAEHLLELYDFSTSQQRAAIVAEAERLQASETLASVDEMRRELAKKAKL